MYLAYCNADCLWAGYTDLTGGYEGGQAEYARVPFGAPQRTACCQVALRMSEEAGSLWSTMTA